MGSGRERDTSGQDAIDDGEERSRRPSAVKHGLELGVSCRPQVRPGPAKSRHPPDVDVKARAVVGITLLPPNCILKMCKREG